MEFLRKNWGFDQKYLLPDPMAPHISEDLKENNATEETAKEAKDNGKSRTRNHEAGVYDNIFQQDKTTETFHSNGTRNNDISIPRIDLEKLGIHRDDNSKIRFKFTTL